MTGEQQQVGEQQQHASGQPSTNATRIPTLRTGDLAYYDSFAGPVPCRVLSITGQSGPCGTDQRVTVEVTGTGTGAHACYRKGEQLESFGLNVFPRRSLIRGKYSSRIGFYHVQVD